MRVRGGRASGRYPWRGARFSFSIRRRDGAGAFPAVGIDVGFDIHFGRDFQVILAAGGVGQFDEVGGEPAWRLFDIGDVRAVGLRSERRGGEGL